jgi:hypothetical protein
MCPLTQQYAYELNVKKIKLIIPFQCKLTLPQLVKLKTLFLPEKRVLVLISSTRLSTRDEPV